MVLTNKTWYIALSVGIQTESKLDLRLVWTTKIYEYWRSTGNRVGRVVAIRVGLMVGRNNQAVLW